MGREIPKHSDESTGTPGSLYYKHQKRTEHAKATNAWIFIFVIVAVLFFVFAENAMRDSSYTSPEPFEPLQQRRPPVENPATAAPELPGGSLTLPMMKPMTVSEAYHYLSGRKMSLQKSGYILPEEETYLKQVFGLVDLGIIERAQILDWHKKHNRFSPLPYKHGKIIEQLDMLNVPSRLKQFHSLLLEGLAYQRVFFEQWRQNPSQSFNTKNAMVQKSHNKIYTSYIQLIQLYRNDRQNKGVFFQQLYTLCLD